ncbi:branched-chain amino acid aminotransferase [Sediminihabitans luteus]|uniref:Branched-chain amino acid aminotransferase n=1 Tax=Sediminihabitans luteus TaxID=1138585 RepID=A0A2M9CQM4_9CELL|nr:aminotransferase class IV [Sediminihabitans luteus]PJJ74131.1 branched-chain amino acid aminotransferase [Sediminihabitans luteus]GII97953.1 4-amino-4-deoxychorismate lyase [Sediminihabitans luteus]
MTLVLWADGELVGENQPALSAVDHGVTVGDGVFETCAVDDGRPFALTRHLRRLAASAAGLGLEAPDEARVREGVAAVLAAAPDAGRLRITVTAGIGPLGSARTPGAQTVVVAAAPATAAATAAVVRSPWTRNERSAVAGLKTTSYAENVVALLHAQERGGDEAVLANTVGDLCEGTGSNVFVERGGELVTPRLDTGCLAGITRELVLEWGAAEGIPVREARPGELPFEVLDDVLRGEAHLAITSSVRNLQPVVTLDGTSVEAGPLCAVVQTMFARRRAETVDP